VDPARRITAKEALEHEFFAIGEVDSHKTVLQKLKVRGGEYRHLNVYNC